MNGTPLQDFADPHILFHDGTYYAYGNSGPDFNYNGGIPAFSSTDLINWEYHGLVFEATDTTWSQYWLWGAHCFEKDGLFYLFYSASNSIHIIDARRPSMAISSSPLGPFEEYQAPLSAIFDAHGPILEIGGRYFTSFYRHRRDAQNSLILNPLAADPWLIEFTPDLKGFIGFGRNAITDDIDPWDYFTLHPREFANDGYHHTFWKSHTELDSETMIIEVANELTEADVIIAWKDRPLLYGLSVSLDGQTFLPMVSNQPPSSLAWEKVNVNSPSPWRFLKIDLQEKPFGFVSLWDVGIFESGTEAFPHLWSTSANKSFKQPIVVSSQARHYWASEEYDGVVRETGAFFVHNDKIYIAYMGNNYAVDGYATSIAMANDLEEIFARKYNNTIVTQTKSSGVAGTALTSFVYSPDGTEAIAI